MARITKKSQFSSASSCCSKQRPACTDCKCGDDCQCTETLCQCAASSILNSLQKEHEAKWEVRGMTCQSCVKTVQAILGKDSLVSLEDETASALVTSRKHAEQLTQELEDVGFEATLVGPTISSSHAKIPPKPLLSHETTLSLLESNTEPVGDDPLAPLPPDEDHYAPVRHTVQMVIAGMTCSMCTMAITRALQSVHGVLDVKINLATDLATIDYQSPVTQSLLRQTVEAVGYDVKEIFTQNKLEHLQELQQNEVLRRKRAFLWSLLGTIPIFTLTMILPHVLPSTNPVNAWLMTTVHVFGADCMRESLLLWFLATPVQFGCGWTFYKTAYHGIQSGMLGMDVLVALGTTASYGYAVNEMLQGQEAHFFETSSVLLAFVLLGKWMNSLAVRRTSEALTQLMTLQAKTAIRVIPKTSTDIGNSMKPWDPQHDAYDEAMVPIEDVNTSDTVKILRGASIPADGIVSHGEMTVDESMITGESIPVLKTPGSLVLGGTVCVESGESGAAFVSVTGVGSSTALAQIVQLVEDAQTRQIPIQSLADSISSVFVPAVCTLSVITFMVWYALCNTGVAPQEWYAKDGAATFSLMFGIACLVISCPCALGLAAPTAVMVGTGVGASHGVLMKGGEALEKASAINSVVFDKTGTLTKGTPCISDFIKLPNAELDSVHLLWLLASLERNSEHPLATAVVTYAESKMDPDHPPLVQPVNFRALTGRGALGEIGNVRVAVGNRQFAAMMNLAIPEGVEEIMIKLEEDGKTAILAAISGTVCVVMGVADELKPDAAASIKYLQEVMNMDVWMVTGDNARTARAISSQLGLPQNRVISEALPVAKVRQVKKLQSQGRIVAMIGDGINDSPALAQADVGMSLGTGAEIAAEASDMVLVRGHVADVCTALDLSQVIFRRIQWNFVWSLLYNCLGIPVAAGVFYPLIHTRLPPTVAALAMALSSLSVVCSSLALRFYQPPNVEKRRGSILNRVRKSNSYGFANGDNNDLTQGLLANAFIGELQLCDESDGANDQTTRMEEGRS